MLLMAWQFVTNGLGQSAVNLARDPQMIQILSVKSARKVEKTLNRLEGALLRRSRFLGWRSVWVRVSHLSINFFDFFLKFVFIQHHLPRRTNSSDSFYQQFLQLVLERGVLNYYPTRADSTGIKNKTRRMDFKYLDNARVILSTVSTFIVHFSDGSVHRLSCMSNDEKALVERQVS